MARRISRRRNKGKGGQGGKGRSAALPSPTQQSAPGVRQAFGDSRNLFQALAPIVRMPSFCSTVAMLLRSVFPAGSRRRRWRQPCAAPCPVWTTKLWEHLLRQQLPSIPIKVACFPTSRHGRTASARQPAESLRFSRCEFDDGTGRGAPPTGFQQHECVYSGCISARFPPSVV